MDDRRFDNAVRALARHRSRRGLLGGLLGGGAALLASHLRFPGAAARHRHVRQGDWCVDDDQCDPWLECRWNGYGSAGGACCAFPGGACDDDFGCCDTATCFGGMCTEMTSAPSPGEPCQVDGNPCVYASGYFYCGYVEWTGDYRCCASEGDRCGGNESCCGSNTCVGGVCTSQSGGASASGVPWEWCGNTLCDPSWQRCCNASCGICSSLQGVCPDFQCYECPGCASGYCTENGDCL